MELSNAVEKAILKSPYHTALLVDVIVSKQATKEFRL
jgi:hypothetical protein